MVSRYKEKSSVLLKVDYWKIGWFALHGLLVSGLLFTAACSEEGDELEDIATSTGGASPITGTTGGTGSLPNNSGVDTGGTDNGGPKRTPTGGTISTGGTKGAPTGGVGGTEEPPNEDDGTMEPTGGSGEDDIAQPTAGTDEPVAGSDGATGTGTCCPDGNCLCHGPDPTALTSESGPYNSESYNVMGAGCVFYPTDAEPPFAAVTVADGFMGAGGCMSFQTGQWGPFYASWGIVAMIVNTGAGDVPPMRAQALLRGIEAFKAENENSGSPLFGKLSGRYSTSGFSMGGGGTTMAASEDPTLLSSVAIMAWTPVGEGVTVPTLFICGSMDTLAGCAMMGTPMYAAMPDTTPKMRVTIASPHMGQPSSGMGVSGQYGLAFQKVFLEGDERWRPILLSGNHDETNIQ